MSICHGRLYLAGFARMPSIVGLFAQYRPGKPALASRKDVRTINLSSYLLNSFSIVFGRILGIDWLGFWSRWRKYAILTLPLRDRCTSLITHVCSSNILKWCGNACWYWMRTCRRRLEGLQASDQGLVKRNRHSCDPV